VTSDDICVVDASAFAASLFNESDAEAIALRVGESRLAAPGLLRFELANVALEKVRAEPDRREEILAALGEYEDFNVREITTPPESLAMLAEEQDLSAYDASYLYAAILLDAPLITLDKKLAAAARRLQSKKD